MQLRDTPNGYGWVSIGLHWVTALGVIALLFVGSAIGDETSSATLQRHTTIALCLYVVFWGRIAWRIRLGHPKFEGPTRPVSQLMATLVHYGLIAALAVMLVSGPLMTWSGGRPLMFFDWQVPSPIPIDDGMFQMLRSVHAWAAAVLGLGVTLHICGVLKHMIFDNDGVFDRIMLPAPLPKEPSGRRDP